MAWKAMGAAALYHAGTITPDQMARIALVLCPEAEVLRITINEKYDRQTILDLRPYQAGATYAPGGAPFKTELRDRIGLLYGVDR